MTTPLFLKSETFGTFDFSYVPAGGVCPPGQVPTPTKCAAGPCPDLCLAGETMVLSGEPEAQDQPAQSGWPGWLIGLIIAIPVIPVLQRLAAGARAR